MVIADWIKVFVAIGIGMLVIRNVDLLKRLTDTFNGILTNVTHLGDRTA